MLDSELSMCNFIKFWMRQSTWPDCVTWTTATVDRRATCGCGEAVITITSAVIDWQIVELLVPEFMEVKLVPGERVQQRFDEQIVELLLPQISRQRRSFEILPQEHFSEKICEQIVNVSVPQVLVEGKRVVELS